MKLTEHFDLSEFLQSQTAARLGLDNSPSEAILENLKKTAAMMEKVRTLLGDNVIVVSSGYRSPAVNKAVGGVARHDSSGREILSAHTAGQAVDFICPGFGTPRQVAAKIAENLDKFPEVDQVIWEFSAWVHLAWSENPRRDGNRILTIDGRGARFGIG